MTPDAGMVKPHGAENSAAKNTAPLSLTPLRISEKDGDARAWFCEQAHCTIVVLKRTSSVTWSPN